MEAIFFLFTSYFFSTSPSLKQFEVGDLLLSSIFFLLMKPVCVKFSNPSFLHLFLLFFFLNHFTSNKTTKSLKRKGGRLQSVTEYKKNENIIKEQGGLSLGSCPHPETLIQGPHLYYISKFPNLGAPKSWRKIEVGCRACITKNQGSIQLRWKDIHYLFTFIMNRLLTTNIFITRYYSQKYV